ncbi:D-erythronate dehydrogenase [Pseudonocardia sp.]|jgi:nucleoside-diphosphate-sugar epimerase|uniref:D-erythronate dehydrogenase n=1 Tax=Pseudonocardia sp. TaxID=60912 RepID=UPI003D0FB130
MKVVVTGAAGFLGGRLARTLLDRGELDGRPVDELVLLDVVAATVGEGDPRVRTVVGDVADPALLGEVVDAGTDVVFHLAAVVSGQAEAEFDLGMRINLDGSRLLLDACRAAGSVPRVVFTSSVAVYGGELPDVVTDSTPLTPQTSYGTQKACAELLLADHTRKGHVDGRVLRLPTVTVRPGRPNAAASGFASGIVREPLAGVATVVPVPPQVRMWVLSPRYAVEALVAGAELASGQLGGSRAVNLPGVSVSVGEMAAALGRVAGPEVASLVSWERDPAIEAIAATWPGAWDTSRAEALGLRGDPDFDAIVRAYMEDDMP